MADFLRSKRIERLTLEPFLLEQAERVKKHAGVMASKAGRPYQYLSGPTRKEDVARKIAERDGIDEGLVCVFSVLEPCRTFSLAGPLRGSIRHASAAERSGARRARTLSAGGAPQP